jgi:hypothetical protein
MSRRTRTRLAAVLVSIALAGCGIQDPYETRTSSAAPAASGSAPHAARAQAAQLPAAQSAGQVIARFTGAWVNWTAADLAAQRRELLALAAGQLARELRREAAQAVRVQLQQVSGAYSRGRLIGVIPRAAGRAIVVTYEQAAPQGGTAQSAYYVYIARAQRTSQGWRLIEWQPASDS